MIEKLYPAFKDNLWGGERLVERYGKVTDMRPCAESWELSMHPAGVSRLADGRLISEALGARELGENVGAFDAFPMLIKFIDARDDLSVQVHPSDEYALKNENSYGKTELWYVVEADEGAGIYLGFKRRVSAEEAGEAIREEKAELLIVAAATEADIAELESYEERQIFLEELGIEESGVSRLIKAAYALLGLETFFTTGADESRAWTYTKGFKAPQAAGVIHTDFERGFIRAEVIKYDDYVALGSEKACREAGKIGIEGKEYTVQDGDIMHFLFNV